LEAYIYIKPLKNNQMKNKKIIIIGTSFVVISVLYFAYKKKKSNDENIINDVELKDLLKKIDNAKK